MHELPFPLSQADERHPDDRLTRQQLLRELLQALHDDADQRVVELDDEYERRP